MFGINAGPEHLNGLPWSESPWLIRGLVILADLMVAALVVGLLIRLVKSGKDVRRFLLKNIALFLGFIAMCIASSSVTIRVEMRWVYVSLAAALLFMAWMYGVLTADVKKELYLKRLWPWGAAFACYVLLMLPVELFYRGYYPKLYLWPNQLRYNSLAGETYEKYGDQLFGKTIYIIGDSYEMSDFTANTFFKVFDPERKAQGTRVVHIKSIRDFGLVTDNMLVLREDPENNAFQDVTEFVRELKLKPEYGYYRDGWMDEHAEISVMAGSTGSIDLEIMYPGLLRGGETISITREGWPPDTMAVQSSVIRTSIHVEPFQTVRLRFDYNFYMQDAQEQRGVDRLAAIVNIEAD